MTIGTLKLSGDALAQCSSFSVRVEFLGGATVLADGTLRRDLAVFSGHNALPHISCGTEKPTIDVQNPARMGQPLWSWMAKNRD